MLFAHHCHPEQCCPSERPGRGSSFDRPPIQYPHQYLVCGIYHNSNTIVRVLSFGPSDISTQMPAETYSSTDLEDRLYTFLIASFSGGSFPSVLVCGQARMASEVPLISQTVRICTEVWVHETWFYANYILTLIWMSSYHAVLVSRLLLGLTEATYYPGVVFILSTWCVADCLRTSLFRPQFSRYKRDKLGLRIAYFCFGVYFGAVLGPLIASGILATMDGILSYVAWR